MKRVNMSIRLSNELYNRHSRSITATLLLVSGFFFWLFNFSGAVFSAPAIAELGQGQGLLDLRLYYTPEEARETLACLGPEGRHLYWIFLAFDFIFPLAYGLGFAFLISGLGLALHRPESPWRRFNLLPLGIALADYAENFCTATLLLSYPAFPFTVAALGGAVTLLKYGLTAITLAYLPYALARLVYLRLRSS